MNNIKYIAILIWIIVFMMLSSGAFYIYNKEHFGLSFVESRAVSDGERNIIIAVEASGLRTLEQFLKPKQRLNFIIIQDNKKPILIKNVEVLHYKKETNKIIIKVTEKESIVLASYDNIHIGLSLKK